MDAPVSSSYQRHIESSTTAMRPSPPGSSGGSPQGMIPPPNPLAIVAPPGRPSGLTAPLLHQVGSRSPGGYNSNSYPHSTSPSTASGGVPDIQSSDPSSLNISPTQVSTPNLNAQKRAYRQRRKDPSCDACRERKVKCDATETTACSECSSRNHKCQFTKETNRRMSSIKQVQDLQSQIAELTQQNSHLRTRFSDRHGMETDPGLATVHRLDSHSSLRAATKRVPVPVLNGFEHVRKNIRIHSRAIFEPPAREQSHPSADAELDALEVPSQADFSNISRTYLDSIHEAYPVLHWPTFQSEVDRVYISRSFQGTSREWVGLFFAVLACGCLNSSVSNGSRGEFEAGAKYYNIASQIMTPWPQDPSIIHARLLLLLSIYAAESNMKSAGSMWLSCAVRVSQELSFNIENDAVPFVEAELQQKLWWAIYVRERIASLGSNTSMMIIEEDCDIPLPPPVEGQNMLFRTRGDHPYVTGSVAVVHITRLFAGLSQTLRSSVVPIQALQIHEDQFRAKLSILPENHHPESDAYLEPAALSPTLTLQFARFHLFRRNLSPVCQQADRAAALASCTLVAQTTATYISRTLQTSPRIPDLDRNWQTRVSHLASNMICIHVWRCMLVLCLRGDYASALICLQLSTAIGDIRKVNRACGKNLLFFLDRLIDRIRSGNGAPQQLEHDEELLAYASADLQSALEHAWVWSGESSSYTSPTSTTTTPPTSARTHALPLRPVPDSPDNAGTREWDGWGRVEHMIRQLIEEQRPRGVPAYYPTPHNPVKRVQLGPEAGGQGGAGGGKTSAPSSASRISIANII